MKNAVMLLTAAGLLICTHQALAGLTFYTDRTAWSNAISGDIEMEDFDSVTPYSMTNNIVNPAGSIGIELLNALTSTQNAINDGSLGSSSVNGTHHFRGNFSPFDSQALIILHLPHAVTAFGGDFFSTHNSDGLALEFDGQQYLFEDMLPSGNGDGFWGIISSSPFTTITLLDPVQNDSDSGIYRVGETFGLDNVSFAEVPEPTAFCLLTIGSLCLRRRKRTTR